MAYDTNAAERYIRQRAAAMGIDPDVAVKVAKGEGLKRGVWQSNVVKNGRREPSYGPLQLLVGGGNTGFPEGMGNQMIRETGINPADPNNWKAAIDFGLGEAAEKGWGQWYGAKAAGITGMEGIGGRPADAAPYNPYSHGKQQQAEPITVAAGQPAPALPPAMDVGAAPIVPYQGAESAPAAAVAEADPKTPDGWREKMAKIAKNVGFKPSPVILGNTEMAGMAMPKAARIDTPETPLFDPTGIEQQRQQLAMAMQRLNSGRLWG